MNVHLCAVLCLVRDFHVPGFARLACVHLSCSFLCFHIHVLNCQFPTGSIYIIYIAQNYVYMKIDSACLVFPNQVTADAEISS